MSNYEYSVRIPVDENEDWPIPSKSRGEVTFENCFDSFLLFASTLPIIEQFSPKLDMPGSPVGFKMGRLKLLLMLILPKHKEIQFY